MPELLALRPVNCTASALEPDCKLPLARPSDLLGKPGRHSRRPAIHATGTSRRPDSNNT
eukprot:CAMPEP_0175585082 /NCGR_PEP_ID=MMETSP0096-20121207/49520_1 /TAXON_ID=311494 /ORGANISM="Alexandrium monilatum, Strain CCMP3105" /LENGTH=58 /DNA_ID=CAMNT_0016888877 /DNA_START=55 /DNA_END=228 /DNA_ORIENTATION=+